ncbi:MAG: hypothetical protein K0R90_1622, partial [Oscillospiraceae bacterium]|nr:hypothetical protein [Oscillospiraceae bacterium]
MNVISHFTIRSLKHNRKWTIVTIIGIIISTAMIAAVSTFTSSFLALMQNETIAKDGNWHATIFNVSQQNVDKLKNSDFVRETMLSRNIGYSVLKGSENKSKPYLFIKQYDDNSNKNFHVKLISGRMPQNDQELVLSQKVEDNGGIKHNIGEKLTLNIGKRLAPDGSELYQNAPYQPPETFDQDGNDLSEKFIPQYEKAYTIVGIIESPNFEQTWSPGYTAITYLDSKKMNLDDTVNVTLLAEKLNKHFFNEVNEIAKSVGKTKKDVTANTELLRYYGVVEGDNIQSFLYGFAGVIIVIIMLASISLIYNAFAISVSERTRQLGMLASVGATKRQKRKNVYFEGFLIGIIGIPIGILAGIIGIGITIKAIRPLL